MAMAAKRGKVYTVILQPESDPEFEGYYNASVPGLPGCFSYGTNREEALGSIKEAIEVYLKDLEAGGSAIPSRQAEH
jgi:predicted RNase H-like HicB family nuclease